MIPKKELNIYPKTKKNLKALFSFYFDRLDLPSEDIIEKMMEMKSLSLNQIEFIARKLSESWNEVFDGFFVSKRPSISNIMQYGIDGLTKPEKNWSYGPYSEARPKIKEFLEFVRRTEVNTDCLEKTINM